MNQPNAPASRQELPGIQYVRAIAALLVLLDHGEGLTALPKYFGRKITNGFLEAGFAGVDLFFVLSGFIIVYVAFPRSTPGSTAQSASDFLSRRFVRIVPFLWLCVVSHFLLRLVGRGSFEWVEYVRSFFLWPVGRVKPNQVWTLRHEILFYLLFAISLRSRLGYGLLFLFFVSPVAWWWTQEGIKGTDYAWCDFFFSRCNLLFCAGYCFGVAYIKRWIVIPTLPIGFPLFCVIAGLFLWYVNLSGYERSTLVGVCIMAAICTIILAISIAVPNDDKSPFHTVGKLLGDASYAIYLTHDIFISGLLGILAKYLPQIPAWSAFSFSVGTALISGILIHLYVERPLISYVKKIQFRKRSVGILELSDSTPIVTSMVESN